MNKGVKLESVANLLDKNFFIRSYQRGYRWDDNQVTDLLNDLQFFIDQPEKSEEEFYCLQPIVVKKLSVEDKGKLARLSFGDESIYEVIDGQQRLTTITIILNFLKESLKEEIVLEKIPSITYEAREKSQKIVSNFNKYINSEEDKAEFESNIDFYHMKIVYESIFNWFENQEKKYKIRFLKLLTSYKINCIKVIWYEVEESDNSIEVFRRFNVGKIPLTNAELIKALLLKENESVDNTIKYSISKEWQQIENNLQSKFFWGFLRPSKTYASRIEYIFDLIFLKAKSESKDKVSFNRSYGTDKHNVFRYFSNEINNSTELQTVWDKVNKVFEKLLQWYNHSQHYHYIGYLQNKEERKEKNIIFDLLSQNFETKDDLTSTLVNQISDECKSYFKNGNIALDYQSSKSSLRNLFFLLNIESYIHLSQSSKGEEIYRLPFNLYSSVNYDIEHIDSQAEKDKNALKSEAKIELLKDLEIDYGFEIGDNFTESLLPLFRDLEIDDKWKFDNINQEKIDPVFELTIKLVDDFLEKDSDKMNDKEKGGIGNLTVLNDSINRSYGNSYFNTKRRLIIEEDKRGVYIPVATKNVFLKYFSGITKKHTRWSKSDANNYQSQMTNTFAKFIK